jgi:hypothetical protein
MNQQTKTIKEQLFADLNTAIRKRSLKDLNISSEVLENKEVYLGNLTLYISGLYSTDLVPIHGGTDEYGNSELIYEETEPLFEIREVGVNYSVGNDIDELELTDSEHEKIKELLIKNLTINLDY